MLVSFHRRTLLLSYVFFFFQAEDGIRDLVRSRGLGDVYKRQLLDEPTNDLDIETLTSLEDLLDGWAGTLIVVSHAVSYTHLTLPTSDLV